MGFIYKITNKINNKLYIGKTIQTVGRRFTEHKRDSKTKNTYLYYAMRKYGIDNFYIETIEEVPNQELNNREKYWISFYKSNYSENGYNLTAGGDGNNQTDIYNINKMIELWDNGLIVTDIANELSSTATTVQLYLNMYCKTYSKEEQKRRGMVSNMEKHSIKVLQFDLDGNYIATYNNLRDASKQLDIYKPRIADCCKKLIPNADAYQFIFEGDEHPGKCTNPIFTQKPVCQKDLSGNIIAMYESASNAGKTLKVNSSCIRRCCYKEKKTCKGCTWEFVTMLEYLEYIRGKDNTQRTKCA